MCLAFPEAKIEFDLLNAKNVLETKLFQIFKMNVTEPDIITSFCFQCHCVFIVYNKQSFESFIYVQAIFTALNQIVINKQQLNVVILGYNSENTDPGLKQEMENFKVNFFQAGNNDENDSFFLHFIDFPTKNNDSSTIELKKILYNIFLNPKFIPGRPKNIIKLRPKEEGNEYVIYKIIILGDWAVGKSAFFNRFFSKEFSNSYISTIGVCVSNKLLKVGNINVKLQLWDTAGQERFRAVTKQYYNKADGVLILFDLTKADSFNNLESWLEEMEEQKSNFVIYILGNKLDMYNERVVSKENIQHFLAQKNAKYKYVEVSCKWDLNISDAVYSMFLELFMKSIGKNGKIQKAFTLQLSKKNSSCC